MDSLFILIMGFAVGITVAVLLWLLLRRPRKAKTGPAIHSSIEDLRSVGELIVFKIITKEIVTTAEHWLGEWGKKYFTWLASTKKMAMIFEFEIDFRYNLRSDDFIVQLTGQDTYKLKMPKCFYEIHIRDISFYDEQSAKLLPWLVPDLLNRAFGSGFSEEDKNHLKEEARHQASRIAEQFVRNMQSEVQNSARQTMQALAKAFGAQKVTIDFSDSQLVQAKVENAA